MSLIGLALAALILQSPPTVPPQASAPVTTGTAEVRGRIMSGAPTASVAGASVKLTGGGLIKTSVTDESGRFVFTNLPAGRYAVSVSSNGFAVTSFGGRTPRAVSIDLEQGARVDLGDLILPLGVAISGQILDEHGKPLKGANVSAWRSTYLAPGERRLSFEGQAISDDAGDYRIAGVKPGVYFVDAKAGESIAPTFFPATTSAAMAAAIRVTADVGAAGISIRLLPTPLARVSGAIINAQGQPSADFFVILAPLRDDGAQVSAKDMTSEVDAAGRFSVAKVPPGSYVVQVVSKSRLEKLATSGGGGIGDVVQGAESGSEPVTVDGRDVDSVFIRTSLPTPLSGKVTLDGSAISAEVAKRLMLRVMQNSGPGGIQSVLNATFATPNPDGTFTIPAVPGGRMLRVDRLPAETTLKRVLMHGVDVTDEGFDVGGSPIGDVVIELTSKPAVVSGRIADDRGVPQGGVGVIVFSEDSRRWRLVNTRVVTSARTKADGTFAFTGLPSGSYYAAVVPLLVEGEWAEPANLERLRVAATSFKLSDGEQKTLMLTLR